jgi:hypothetical protein
VIRGLKHPPRPELPKSEWRELALAAKPFAMEDFEIARAIKEVREQDPNRTMVDALTAMAAASMAQREDRQ